MLTHVVFLLKRRAAAQSWQRALIALLLGAMVFATDGFGAAALDANNAVTLRGADAFKVLVGNTLRSVGDSKLIPTFRYFMTERLEYRCHGWDPSAVTRKDIKLYGEAGGCELVVVSLKEGRLCESHQYEQCQDHELKLTFARRSDPTKAADGEAVGLVTLPGTDGTVTALIDHDLIKGRYELIKGNGTIFPSFDPVPKPELLQPDTLPSSLLTQDSARTPRSAGLSDAEATSRIVGNTMVLLGRDGKPDGRAGEYYSPDGRIVVISIPAPTEGADLAHPSAEGAGSIFINRWKVENGRLCRTENDEPTKFICAVSACVEVPEPPSDHAAPRYCAGNSGIGSHAYIAKGNPFRFDFGKSKRK
ncbi:hypothetical protein ABIF97_008670 [Bradyrhizobium japonicum]